MSFSFPEQPVRSARPVHTDQTIRTRKLTRPIYPEHEVLATFIGAVSCPVCDAVYAPAQSHQHLLHAPMIAMESAFMSMCRFCFRCRRPSCPACWDAVNGLCGACVEELTLPFRQEITPFVGILPVKTSSRQTVSLAIPRQATYISDDAPLRCVYTGRFQQTASDVLADALVTTDPVPAAQRNFPRQKSSTTTTHQHSTQDDIEAQTTQPPVSQQKSSPSSVASSVERIFTTLLLALLSILILLVVGASVFPQMNTTIAHILRIDIRAFVLAVWFSIHQLFGH